MFADVILRFLFQGMCPTNSINLFLKRKKTAELFVLKTYYDW